MTMLVGPPAQEPLPRGLIRDNNCYLLTLSFHVPFSFSPTRLLS